MNRLYTFVDVVRLAKNANTDQADWETGYDKYALSLALQVERGECDPLAAEAMLEATTGMRPSYGDCIDSPKFEKCGSILARLVEGGAVDPIVAENALDRGLGVFALTTVIDSISSKK